MVISTDLALALHDAGLRWEPAPGDRFAIRTPALAGQVFTLSEMTIEAHHYPTGTVLGFNGTTEWALDSVEKDETLWLPREDQLRELLGRAFVSLVVHDDGADRFVVTARWGDAVREFGAPTAADAYGSALLALVEEALADVGA